MLEGLRVVQSAVPDNRLNMRRLPGAAASLGKHYTGTPAVPFFPYRVVREEMDEAPLYAQDKRTRVGRDDTFVILGVAGEDCFHIYDIFTGQSGYAKSEDFWEGNGFHAYLLGCLQ